MRNLTKGSPIKAIVLFTIPLLIGNIFQQLYNVIDTLIVGRAVGVNALAAVGATGSLSYLIIGFAQGITSGFSLLTAQRFGAQDYRGVKHSFATSIMVSLVLTVVLTVLSIAFAKPLLILMQTPKSILNDAYSFIVIIFGGIFASMGFNLLSNMIRAIGDSRTPLFFLVVATAVNIVLDLILIMIFHMGVVGAGIATVSAQVVSAILCVIYIYRRIPYLQLRRKDFYYSKRDIRDHLNVGLPMGFQSSIIAIGGLIIQVILNTLGANAVAAFTAAGKIEQIATLPAMSFGITLATFAAQNYGAREFSRIRQGVRQTLAVSISFDVIMGALIIGFGRPLVNMFIGNHQPVVTNLAQTYFLYNASMYWLLAILYAFRYTLQGLGKGLVPTLAGLGELIMRAFVALVLVRYLGFVGVSLANPLAWLGSTLIMMPSYFKTMHQLKKLQEDPPKENIQNIDLNEK